MELENISGGKYSLTLTGHTLEHGDKVEVESKSIEELKKDNDFRGHPADDSQEGEDES